MNVLMGAKLSEYHTGYRASSPNVVAHYADTESWL